MSRNIDLTKPLSKADRAYLEARSRFIDIAMADRNNPPSGSEASPDTAELTPEERYRAMKVPQLQALLTKRKEQYEADEDDEGVEIVSFTTADKKDDLVQKLLDDDASSEDDGDEDSDEDENAG